MKFLNMKIGIVGLGYWGKIILKNLKGLGYKNIKVYEPNKINWGDIGFKVPTVESMEDLLDRDKIFVVTPTNTHSLVCNFFIKHGVDIFCEKPLTNDLSATLDLYKNINKNSSKLFVDWLFTFNPAVKKIKEIIQSKGAPKTIISNRLNYGPQRFDVDARLDLSSHDVSIMLYWLEVFPTTINWLDFKRNKSSVTNDSNIGVLLFNVGDSTTSVQINSSWEFGEKNRDVIIEFYDGEFLKWNDFSGLLTLNGSNISFENYSPLEKSISTFLENKFDQEKNKLLTININKILQNEDTI